MSVESSRGGVLRCRAVLFAVLAALLYAVSTPVSKLLLERISPTLLAGLLYLGTVVVERGREIEALGVKPKDALHLASAEKAECDWLFTTDKGILKKVQRLGEMRVANPIEFAMEDDNDACEHL